MKVAERVEDLRDPALPGLELDGAVVPLGLAQELLQRAGGHVLRDEDQSRQFLVRGLRAAAANRVPLLRRSCGGGPLLGGSGRCGGGHGALLSCKMDGLNLNFGANEQSLFVTGSSQ